MALPSHQNSSSRRGQGSDRALGRLVIPGGINRPDPRRKRLRKPIYALGPTAEDRNNKVAPLLPGSKR